MPLNLDGVNKQFDDLQAAVVKEQNDVGAFIASLKAQVAAGAGVTQDQLDALATKAGATKDMVSTFDINNSEPVVVPDPLPPVV